MLAWRMATSRCGSALMPSDFGFPLQALPRIVGLLQCWSHPEGSCSLLHPPIEAGQMSAAAVQRHRQMQGVTRAQAEARILEQLGRLAKAVAIERAQFHSALQQALELLPSRLACC
jgi:hypothetical protein